MFTEFEVCNTTRSTITEVPFSHFLGTVGVLNLIRSWVFEKVNDPGGGGTIRGGGGGVVKVSSENNYKNDILFICLKLTSNTSKDAEF